MSAPLSLPELIQQARTLEPHEFSQQVVAFFGPAVLERIQNVTKRNEADTRLLRLTTFAELGGIIEKLPGADPDFLEGYPAILDELVQVCQWKLTLLSTSKKPMDLISADTQLQAGILRWIDQLANTPDAVRIKQLLDNCTTDDKIAIARRTLRATVAHVVHLLKTNKRVSLFASYGRHVEIDRELARPFLLQQIDLYVFLFTDHPLAGAFIADSMVNLKRWLRKELLGLGVTHDLINDALDKAESEVYDDLLRKRTKPDDEKSNVGADASLTTTVISFIKQNRFIPKFLRKNRIKSDTDLVERTAQDSSGDDDEDQEDERDAVLSILQDGLKQIGQDCREFFDRLYLKPGASVKKKDVARQVNKEPKKFYQLEESCRKKLAKYVRQQCEQQRLTIWLR